MMDENKFPSVCFPSFAWPRLNQVVPSDDCGNRLESEKGLLRDSAVFT